MFFESLAECSLGFTYVCVAAVDVTRDVIGGSTLVFFVCFVLPSKSEATHVTPVPEQGS